MDGGDKREGQEELVGFLEAMERINTVIRGAAGMTAMLEGCLEALLDIMACDRVYLFQPCDPTADTYVVPLERTRPAWPGAFVDGQCVEPSDFLVSQIRGALDADGPYWNSSDSGYLPDAVHQRFCVRADMMLVLDLKTGPPWLLGLHHCEAPHQFSHHEVRLFESVGQRIGDAVDAWNARRELEASEARFRSLVEHAPEAILLLHVASAVVIDANPKATELFGRSRALIVGTSLPRLGAGGDNSANLISAIARTENQQTVELEWTALSQGGRRVECELHLVRLPGAEAKVRCTLFDVSERRRLAAQLERAQKLEAVGLLAGGVAHDFNNMLTVIMAHAQLLSSEHSSEAEAILHAAERAASLTRQLLTFSRGVVRQPRLANLNETVEESLRFLRRVIGEHITLDFESADEVWLVRVDPVQMHQVVMNLAINARDAMPDGGHLRISTKNLSQIPESAGVSLSGPCVVLAVHDTGTGMDAATVDRIFDPFFTTKADGRGTGLGLATLQGILRENGGAIEVCSEVGVGSCFNVYLPRANEAAALADRIAPATSNASGRGEAILLVEDDSQVRKLSARILTRAGYLVTAVSSPSEALERWSIDGHQVELLVTDAVLPEMHGEQLVRRMRADREDLRVLCVSGYAPDARLQRAVDSGEVSFLAKPFQVDELLSHVRMLLDAT